MRGKNRSGRLRPPPVTPLGSHTVIISMGRRPSGRETGAEELQHFCFG
jgi:hypothetical protein